MQKLIELMENIAEYRGQIDKYRTYIKEHPSCSFEWENKIAKMEKVLMQMERQLWLMIL